MDSASNASPSPVQGSDEGAAFSSAQTPPLDATLVELNVGGHDVLAHFQLRQRIYESRTMFHDACGTNNDDDIPALVDANIVEECRQIEENNRRGHEVLSETLSRYEAARSKLNAVLNAQSAMRDGFHNVNAALVAFEQVCMRYDRGAHVVEGITKARDTLSGIKSQIDAVNSDGLPDLHKEVRAAAHILYLLSNTYRGLRHTQESMFTCPVCLDRQVESYLNPCGHTLCKACSNECISCPMCRKPVHARGDLYFT